MKLLRSQLEMLINKTHLSANGKNLYGMCPSCGFLEFGISLDDNHVFACFRTKKCNFRGNIYTLLSFLGRSREFLGDRQVNVFGKVEAVTDESVMVAISPAVELPEVKLPLFWERVADDLYLRSRGFVDHQFNKFEVGRSKANPGYVTFLVRQDARLVGYLGRSEKSKLVIDTMNEKRRALGQPLYPRYDNSTGSDFSKMLFGLDEITPGVTTEVILVEGVLSKTKTDVNLGLDFQEDVKCCATFGAKLSVDQLNLLRHRGVETLTCWFEADVLKQIKSIVAEASINFNVLVGYLPRKDPNDLSQAEAEELYRSAVDWFDFNMSKVQSKLKVR